MNVKIAYKLFRVKSDESLTSLFINKQESLEINKWIKAKFYPTKGFKERLGWHCCKKPKAPHLSNKGRDWYKVKIKDYKEFQKPEYQGGKWYTSNYLMILNKVS